VTGAEARWNAIRTLLGAHRVEPPIASVPRAHDPPASFAQEALWLLDRLQPYGSAYNLAVACRIVGALDIGALEQSLTELARRHEALRTTLRVHDGVLIQRIDSPPTSMRLEAQPVALHALEAWTAEQAAKPFDLAAGPLLRLALARVEPREHWLVIAAHHAIFDAWSFEIFMHELCALYGAYAGGYTSPLPPPPALRYGDFAAWQRQRLAGEACGASLRYWKQQLDGELPLLTLPVDHPRRPLERRRSGSHKMTLGPELTAALTTLAVRQGATLYAVLLAAFQALLHRYSGERDIVVGSAVAGRHLAGSDGVIGLFTNLLPLRARVDGGADFRELLERVRETTTAALAHQDVPFELLVKELQPPRHPDRSPFFDVMFLLQNVPRAALAWPGVDVEAHNLAAPSAKLDLVMTMQQTSEGLRALLEYDAELFEATTMARLLCHFSNLLDSVAQYPERRVDELPLLSHDERRELIANASTAPSPRNQSIHGLFEEQVRRAPEAIAVVAEQETWTYEALNRRANRLARRLAGLSLPKEALVAVCLERSPALVMAQLAIAKAGLAYVPIDVHLPHARAEALLSKVAAIVTDAGHAPSAPLPRLFVNDAALERERDDDLGLSADADQLAYVMFTSGSTGSPRGVCVPHRGVVRLVRDNDYARFGPDEAFLQLAPASFDAATFEIWGALLNGGRLVLAPARPLSIAELVEVIRRREVTTLWLTSGLFEAFVDASPREMPSLRQLLTGGDALSVAHAERFLRQMPRCRLINGYGPTENTTFTCAHAVERVQLGRSIPIGRPIANTSLYVLDERMQLVPNGVIGEAYVGGDGLARGYLDDEEATRERFVPDPFHAGQRLYRTGDRVRRRADGVLEFMGRIDGQVKIRGFRVEPAELERVVRQCPAVSAAAVVVEGSAAGDKRLVAYVVPRMRSGDVTSEVRACARARLPSYMLPSRVVVVERLPLTANGKIDRRVLPQLAPAAEASPKSSHDALEATLLALFSQALDGRTVAADESFFDAGGDSLAAVRLTITIERETGVELPLATLFARPTVAELASELRRRQPISERPRPLVIVKRGGSARPLFLVAGGRGGQEELGIYGKLFSRLAVDDAVFGLTAPAHSESVEQIAATHVAALRALQPHGPYRIGGECVGGVVAFEMARQLDAAGEATSLLLLIDSWCPTNAGVLHHNLLGHPRDLLKLGLSFLVELRHGGRGAEPWWHELRRRALPSPAAKEYIRACMRHRPRSFAGSHVTLLASEVNLRRGIADGWRRIAAAGLTIHRAPGDHQTYARQHADATAEQLRICVEGGQ
jgi:aspartate racemase